MAKKLARRLEVRRAAGRDVLDSTLDVIRAEVGRGSKLHNKGAGIVEVVHASSPH